MLISSFSGSYFGAAKQPVKKKVAIKPKKPIVKVPVTKARAAVAATVAATTARAVPGSASQLQADLVTLGKIVKDSTLEAVKVDGLPGPKTATAVNRALSKYATSAPATYRTGKLTLAAVKADGGTLIALLEAEIKRRGGTVVPAKTVAGAKAAKKAATKVAAAQKAASKKAAAMQKRAIAQAQRITAQRRAKFLREQAAALRAKGDTAGANKAAAQAAEEDMFATQAETKAIVAEQEVQQATDEEATATNEAMVDAANETTPTPAAVAATAKAEREEATDAGEMPSNAPPALAPNAEMGPMPTTAFAPTAEGESFVTRYKWPLIGAGAIGVLGVLALTLKRSRA